MFQRAHRTILIFLAVAGLAAACSGGSSASPPEPTDSTVASTAGGTVATNGTASPATAPIAVGMRLVGADRFSIVVPEGWRALLLDESGTITSDRADDPAPAQPLEQLAIAAALQGGKLLAVADADASTNLLVVALGPEEAPAEADLTEGFRARLAESGVTDMKVEMVELPAGRAVRGQYVRTAEGPDGQVTNGVASAYIALPTTSWLLTLTAPIGDPQLAAFDEIAGSFTPV